MRAAIIDLGSNTFHFVIAEKKKDHFTFLHRERTFVHLSERGVYHIYPEVMDRALVALEQYWQTAKDFGVQKIVAIGTETLRQADNSLQLIQKAKEQIGIDIEIISGEQEATFISRGVALLAKDHIHNSLVMDVGGGSTEFILHQADNIHSLYSLPLGSTVLFNQFSKSDPLSKKNIEEIGAFLHLHLLPLLNSAKALGITKLIGTSGTFEVLSDSTSKVPGSTGLQTIQVDASLRLIDSMLRTTLRERMLNPLIPSQRAKLLPVAFVLCRYVIQHIGIQEIHYSEYSMKEGILEKFLGE